MESTPIYEQISHDSGCVSASFSASSIIGSTPYVQSSTPFGRKRKFGDCQSVKVTKRLNDVFETKPQFSSTLNESLVDNLEKVHLEPAKVAPVTPVKKTECKDEVKKSRIVRFHEDSPIKAAHDILYANIWSNTKKFSPMKYRDVSSSPVKKCLFESTERQRNYRLFTQITSNTVIMNTLLSFLSDGDLYRLSLSSKSLKTSILDNVQARNRFLVFSEVHLKNKENYQITPPTSPEHPDSPPGSPSRFKDYYKMGQLLTDKQRLTKCPKCGKPSLVENYIGQCQNLVSCGYIHCLKCFSSSTTGPEDFYDRCQSSILANNSNRVRLSDMSNRSRSPSRLYSIFHSPRSNRTFEDSSGFLSGHEPSPQAMNVKRNLTNRLKSVRPNTQVFHLFNDVVAKTPAPKKRASLSAVPVIPLERTFEEPPSPPKTRHIAVGSLQSKRNLKRLTR